MDDSAINKMQQHYWEAKQTFLKKIKKKEDDFLVASDAELDAKLELLKSIDETNQNLLNLLDLYQDRIYVLAQEKCLLGRFLKECSKHDTTGNAGNIMSASGKTFLFTGHQFIILRNIIIRSFRDLQTFQYRAVTDTFFTVEQMEKSRTGYRAALLWMKDISQKLDPDAYVQMDKFKKIQNHVREKKKLFEKLKLDTIQKIDLLSASRCNLFSNLLLLYQNSLKSVWDKTDKTMKIFLDTFKLNDHKNLLNYKFKMLKELNDSDPSNSQDSSNNNNDNESNDNHEEERKMQNFEDKLKEILIEQQKQNNGNDNNNEIDMLIFFETDYTDDDNNNNNNKNEKQPKNSSTSKISKNRQLSSNKFNRKDAAGDNDARKSSSSSSRTLLDFDFDFDDPNKSSSSNLETKNQQENKSIEKLQSFMPSSLIDFGQIKKKNSTKTANINEKTDFFEKLFDLENTQSNDKNKNDHRLASSKSSKDSQTKLGSKTSNEKDSTLDTWLNLFADIDPLSNPEEFEKRFSSDQTNIMDRNC